MFQGEEGNSMFVVIDGQLSVVVLLYPLSAYALPGTDLAYDAMRCPVPLCRGTTFPLSAYAPSGTDLVHTEPCVAMSGTAIADGVLSAYAPARRSPVLT
eukprot:1691632-Rhodomonas_salina.1